MEKCSYRLLRIFLILLSTIICIMDTSIRTDSAFAKSKPNLSTRDIPKKDVSFDMNRDRLPPKFNGNDIAKVYKQLEKSIPKRSEYETAKKYFGRIKEMIPSDLYVFKIETIADIICNDSNILVSYNADKEILEILIMFEKLDSWTLECDYEDFLKRKDSKVDIISKYPDIIVADNMSFGGKKVIPEREQSLVVKSFSNITGSYVGRNAFGATRQVTESQKETFYLALTNSKKIQEEGRCNYKVLRYELAIPPEEAKKVKPNISLLAICRLTPTINPYFYMTEYKLPTIDDPYKRKNVKYYVSINLEAIWIYNTVTGMILYKNKIQE